MPDVDTKKCTKCQEAKPLSEYGKRKAGAGGLHAQCKPCIRARATKWRQAKRESDPNYFPAQYRRNAATDKLWVEANRDRINAQARERRAADPERHREYVRRHREAHADRIDARAREAYAANPEAWRAKAKRNREANLERYRWLDRAKYRRNREALLEKNRKWREANPDYGAMHRQANRPMYAEIQRRRRARIRESTVLEFTDQQLADRMSYFGNKCWICAGPFEEVDHVKPLIKGGPHMLSNLRPSCLRCNRSKGPQWPLKELVPNVPAYTERDRVCNL